MSVDQRAVRKAMDDGGREELRKRIDDWFETHGVPQFAEPYVPEDRLRYLVVPLFVLVAFEIGAAPKLKSLLALLVVPPVVVALLAWARPFIWRALGRKEEVHAAGAGSAKAGPIELNRWRLAGLLAVLGVLGVLVWLSKWPSPWSDAWADFGVILAAECASMFLFTRQVWSRRGARLDRLRRWLVALTVVAVLLFTVLLALDQAAAIDSQGLLDWLTPGGGTVPLAVPALICMVFILWLADQVSREADQVPQEADHVSQEAGGASRAGESSSGTAPRWGAACYPAVPLLVLALAAQTTVLREEHWLGWARAWLPPVAVVVLFAGSAVAWRLSASAWWTSCTSTTRRWLSLLGRRWRWLHRRKRRVGNAVLGRTAWERAFEGAGQPLFLAPLLAASVIGYPAQVGRDRGIEILGRDLLGREVQLGIAAALMFATYVFLVWFFVWFGLDRVGVWVWREVRSDAMQIVQGVAGGLPLLLVFAVFFALTAETWEVVIETETPQFLALVGLLVALTLGVLFLMAKNQLRQAQQQLTGEEPLEDRDQPGKSAEPWERLSKQAMRKGPSRDEQATATVKELLATVPDPPGDGRELVAELGWRMRVNALLVVAVYQALVLVPVGLSALLLFWGVGQLAVSKDMAAEWAFGDSAGTDKMDQIDAMSFVREPWTRVPVVLAAFSVLYLSVSLLTNKEHRTYFFSAASAALRQRLAVRVAYRLRFGDGAAVADTREGEEAAAGAGAQREATVAGAGAQPTTRPAPARRQARTRRHGLPLPTGRSSDRPS